MSSETEREPVEEWTAYAKRSGLIDESGIATDRAKAQTAWFAFTYAWNRSAALATHPAEPPRTVTGDGAGEFPSLLDQLCDAILWRDTATTKELEQFEKLRAAVAQALKGQGAELRDMEARKDAAYLERNQVVAALAKAYPSAGVARTAIEGWSEDWHGCVYIDLPTGQASWHFHDAHAHLFADLPPYVGAWDGHTTEEKYRRLAALTVKGATAAALTDEQALALALMHGSATAPLPAQRAAAIERGKEAYARSLAASKP